jgi:hypothetical protein
MAFKNQPKRKFKNYKRENRLSDQGNEINKKHSCN